MCIKRDHHEVLQPISDLVAEVPRMMSSLAFVPKPSGDLPPRPTDGAFAGLAAYYATTENI